MCVRGIRTTQRSWNADAMRGQCDDIVQAIVKSVVANDIKTAERLMRSMPQERKTSHRKAFFHSLIHECSKVRAPRSAAWCVERMIEDGVKPNTVTINSILNACAQVGDIETASTWWSTMPTLGVTPNGITYNTMINACARAGDARKAEQWIIRMTNDGFIPCLVSYSTLIHAFSKQGMVDKAEEWFGLMLEAGLSPDTVVYNSVMDAYAQLGLIWKAEGWWSHMHLAGVAPDGRTYNSLIGACARAGCVDRAEHWLRNLERSGSKADHSAYGCMLHACAKAGRPEQAFRWADEMARVGATPTVAACNAVMCAHARARDSEGALAWLERMVDDGVAPNKVTHLGIVEAFASAGDWSRTEALVANMILAGFPADNDAILRLSRGIRRSDIGGADEEDFYAERMACCVLIRACIRADDIRGARTWLVRMVCEGFTPPSSLFEVASHFTKAGGGDANSLAAYLKCAMEFASCSKGPAGDQRWGSAHHPDHKVRTDEGPAARVLAEGAMSLSGSSSDSHVESKEAPGEVLDQERRCQRQLEDVRRRSQRLQHVRQGREQEQRLRGVGETAAGRGTPPASSTTDVRSVFAALEARAAHVSLLFERISL
mmetsp:Transcript_29761/g.93837  ORF Transcript_29761/g.93837 Transcript_29761/m.93837 type:complete len:603 (+) Transcript_29761:137-1945(+)